MWSSTTPNLCVFSSIWTTHRTINGSSSKFHLGAFAPSYRCTWLGPPHPLIASIPQCVCTHPIDLMGIHLLRCAHGNERTRTHDVIHDTFVAIAQNVGFSMWDENNYMCFLQPHSIPLINKSTLCLLKRTFTL
jgi:hypothetical protein